MGCHANPPKNFNKLSRVLSSGSSANPLENVNKLSRLLSSSSSSNRECLQIIEISQQQQEFELHKIKVLQHPRASGGSEALLSRLEDAQAAQSRAREASRRAQEQLEERSKADMDMLDQKLGRAWQQADATAGSIGEDARDKALAALEKENAQLRKQLLWTPPPRGTAARRKCGASGGLARGLSVGASIGRSRPIAIGASISRLVQHARRGEVPRASLLSSPFLRASRRARRRRTAVAPTRASPTEAPAFVLPSSLRRSSPPPPVRSAQPAG